MPTNTHVFETRMSARMQASFIKKPVFRSFVNEEERKRLPSGQAVTRPYRSLIRAQDVSRNGTLTFQDLTDTNETLTVNTIKSTPFQIDDFDAVQSNFKLQNEYAADAAAQLKAIVDGDILSEVANAANVVDAADFGGSSGSPIDLDESNVFSVFTAINRKLQEAEADITGVDPRQEMAGKNMPGVGGMAGFFVQSPYFQSVLASAEGNRETPQGDRVGLNGYVQTRGALDLFVSNNLYWTALYSMATTPTDGDTVVIAGVTFTFKTTLGATAGNVLIGGSADAARANLTALINDPATTTANGVALSNTRASTYLRSNREKIDDLVAVNDDTANTMSLTGAGISYYVLDETLTDATDGWSKETQHQIAGQKGCVDMVAQVGPEVKTSEIENGFGIKVKPRILYGKKTFVEGARRMVDVKVNTAALV
jgi:hypothetical protein